MGAEWLTQLRHSDLNLPPGEEVAGDSVEVEIWRDRCMARLVSMAADRWLSSFLDYQCRLVYLPEEEIRRVDPLFARPGDQVGFADGYPFLLISEASLEDLNTRLAQPVSMERFRPNLVVSGVAPYEEDQWRRIRIGAIEFQIAKLYMNC